MQTRNRWGRRTPRRNYARRFRYTRLAREARLYEALIGVSNVKFSRLAPIVGGLSDRTICGCSRAARCAPLPPRSRRFHRRFTPLSARADGQRSIQCPVPARPGAAGLPGDSCCISLECNGKTISGHRLDARQSCFGCSRGTQPREDDCPGGGSCRTRRPYALDSIIPQSRIGHWVAAAKNSLKVP